jgi:hypothetical protein
VALMLRAENSKMSPKLNNVSFGYFYFNIRILYFLISNFSLKSTLKTDADPVRTGQQNEVYIYRHPEFSSGSARR